METIIIVGRPGSGKSILAQTLGGRIRRARTSIQELLNFTTAVRYDTLRKTVLSELRVRDAHGNALLVFDGLDELEADHFDLSRTIESDRAIQKQLEEYLSYLQSLKRFIKKRLSAVIKLLYITSQIHDRLSRSPTPQKKEPPVGGIKVGGEQYGYFRHVAETLYLEKN